MTTYAWTSLADGQSIAFDPVNDVLEFDDAAIHAAQVILALGTTLGLSYAGKSVTLEIDSRSVTHTNVTFADGSKLLIGDDTTATLDDDAANVLSGGAGDDQLVGLDGDDSLIGGSGADNLSGGAGDDLYLVDQAGDVVTEAASEGTDRVQSSVSWTLGANVEDLVLTGGATAGAGNELANKIWGTHADNSLLGGAGNDTLYGSKGNDTAVFSGSSAGYSFSFQGGGVVITDTDTVEGGNDGTDLLFGIEKASFSDRTVPILGELAEFRVNTTTAGGQYSPQIAALADGGFVVTWYSNQTGMYGIYAQRYDAGGVAFGSEFRVDSTTPVGAGSPSVMALSGGGFVVAWNSSFQDGGIEGIYAQRYDASGSAVGEEFQVNTYTPGSQVFAKGAALPDDGFVVSWGSEGEDGDSYGIYAQRYDAAGAVGPEFQVNSTAAGTQDYSSIAALPDGSFVVTWHSTQEDAGDIYARHYDAGGVALGAEFRVNTLTAGYQATSQICIATLADGGYVVTWRSDLDVYARRYDAAGVAADPEFKVSTDTPGYNEHPSIAALADGGFVIAWNNDIAQDVGVQDSYVLRYDASGAAVGEALRVNATLESQQRAPVVAALADGGFVVTWLSWAGDINIDGQRFDADGHPIALDLTSVVEGGDENEFIYGASGGDILGGAGGDDTLSGLAGDDTLAGGNGRDTLVGAAGDDTLNGAGGGDAMQGDDGNDFYYVNSAGDIVVEAAGQGIDKVRSAISYTLTDNTEDLSLAGTGDTRGIGNAEDNHVSGNAGANVIIGGDGDDTLEGLDGNDTVNGADGDDLLVGGSGKGDDRYTGGSGIDTLRYRSAHNPVNVDLTAGHGSGDDIGNDILSGIENVQGGAGADSISGNGLANLLYGAPGDDTLTALAGKDTLQGADGADVLVGGLGNDWYIVDGADTVTELAGQGTDTVVSLVSLTLGPTLENLVLSAPAANGVGNAAANAITGNGGANVLSGLAGNDILKGGAGGDQLFGAGGADKLYGGAGNDLLDGSTGADEFYFVESASTANADTIASFVSGTDKIVLDDLAFGALRDPGPLTAPDFGTYITYTGGQLFYDADGAGPGAGVAIVTLGAGVALAASDIVVI